MNDIVDAEIISKDFILVKFRYRDDYYIHTEGNDFKKEVKDKS